MHNSLFNLPVVTQITPYLSQRQMGELPILVISHPKVRAAIALQGAHLLACQQTGTPPRMAMPSLNGVLSLSHSTSSSPSGFQESR